ncbi:hypothetical protein CDO52_00915 [Nocardiopsis gilva YIM 90087]|uniref:Uncharacterized protein n=1 Tax=Nocardiopsis gilva YIM 90087 TaxID=1235441 RepID=A0A223S087_9ACTN|nr:helix-turn-helix domain-containing protein [Nocardiopsis gilva]ASU81540.1 hypothetical protein CDO52_00915 [Nocardiopsis gilva YIM 90087]
MNDGDTLQLFDALPPHIEDALRASIRRFGVLSPITRDQHGRILDGHHRVHIAEEEGIGIADDVVIHVKDDDEAREIARTLNSDRRHLTEEQRRAVVADLRREGHSVRAIAGALGVGKSTVADDMAQLSGAGQLEQPNRVKSLDGKSRPASRPAPSPEPGPAPQDDVIDGRDDAPSRPHPDLGVGEFWEPSADDPTPLPEGQDRADAAASHADQRATADALGRWVDDDPEIKDAQFRAALWRAIKATNEGLPLLDVERTAQAADADIWDALPRLRERLTTWLDVVEAKRPRGLRAVRKEE